MYPQPIPWVTSSFTFITIIRDTDTGSYRLPHGSSKCANVFARNNKVVEEGEDEVEDEAPPDGDVVEHCPVGGV